jgi:hypothetical protein
MLIRFFLTDIVIQEKRLYENNMHNVLEKHFNISIAHVRSRGGSLVDYNCELLVYYSGSLYCIVIVTW